jgi:hypothetical protein
LAPVTFAATLAGLAPAACSVGVGSGDVTGSLQVPACTFQPDSTPVPLQKADPFNLRPTFFVGEPIDADPINAPRFPANQMIIRVQPSPKRIEDADVLLFWVFDSAAAARCVRGGMPGGVPEWDAATCDRSSGEGRLLIGMTSEKVSAFFALNQTCSKAEVSANALGNCADGSCPDVALCPGRGSWIAFKQFGNIPDDDSKPIPAGFKVNNGETIEASAFHLELCDTATVAAKLDFVLPVPTPNITGVLEGNFLFELQRGQGGAFP